MVQDLRRIAINKTLAVLGIMMIAYPLLQWWGHHDIQLLHAIMAPVPLVAEFTTAAMVFAILWYCNRCPECKQSWSYSKVREIVIPERVGAGGEANKIGPLEWCAVVVEYQCSKCGLSRMRKRKKLMITES